MKAHRSVWR